MKSRKLLVVGVVFLLLSISVSASIMDQFIEALMDSAVPWVFKTLMYPAMMGSLLSIQPLMYNNAVVFCYPSDPSCVVDPGLEALYPYIMSLLIPIYVIAVMFTALFFIVKAGSPRGRSRAKKMFLRLLMGMLFVIFAPMIFQTFLDISLTITKFYLEQVDINLLMGSLLSGKGVAMCYLQCCMLIAIFVTVIILFMRWFMLYIYALTFPVILFLYFFELTLPYGRKQLKETVKWIFVTPLQAAIFFVMVNGPLIAIGNVTAKGLPVAVQALFTQVVAAFVVIGGLITMCAAPMIMTNVLTFVGTAIYSAGLALDNLPLMSLGGVVSGNGPGAFSNAHGHFSRMRAFESFRSGLFGSNIGKSGPKAMRMLGTRGSVEGRGGGVGGGIVNRASFGGSEARPTLGGALADARWGSMKSKRKSSVGSGEKQEFSHDRSSGVSESSSSGSSVYDVLGGGGGMAERSPMELIKGVGDETKTSQAISSAGIKGFAELPASQQQSLINSMQKADGQVKSIASIPGVPAGNSEALGKSVSGMQKDMKEMHREVTSVKKPGQLTKDKTTKIRKLQKSFDKRKEQAKKELSAIKKFEGTEMGKQKDIMALEQLIKDTEETKEGKPKKK